MEESDLSHAFLITLVDGYSFPLGSFYLFQLVGDISQITYYGKNIFV
jgi:hypothetical protein